jgi:hypothetical protein
VLLLALLVLDAPLWFAVAGVLLVAPLAARLLDDEV